MPLYIIECLDSSGIVYQYRVFKHFSCDFRSGGWGIDPIIPWADNPGCLAVWVVHDINCYGFRPWHPANKMMLEMSRITTIGPTRGRIAYLGVQPFKGRAWSKLEDWGKLEAKFRANQGKVEYRELKKPSLPEGLKISL